MTLRPDHGLVRGVRAGVLAVPAVGAAALAHVLVDGCADVWGTVAAVGLVWPAAVALLGRRRSTSAFLLWVLGAQAATHVLLELTCRAVTSGEATLGQHLVGTASREMLAAHLVAAAFTALLLGRADAGLWAAHALVRLVSRLLPPSTTVVLPLRRVLAVPTTSTVLQQQVHHRLPGRRGPPAPLSA